MSNVVPFQRPPKKGGSNNKKNKNNKNSGKKSSDKGSVKKAKKTAGKKTGKKTGKITGKGTGMCQHGFHKWQVVKDSDFEVKQGKLVTLYRCERCGKEKLTAH